MVPVDSKRARLRLLLAYCGSVATHALLAWLFSLSPLDPVPVVPRASPIQVELVRAPGAADKAPKPTLPHTFPSPVSIADAQPAYQHSATIRRAAAEVQRPKRVSAVEPIPVRSLPDEPGPPQVPDELAETAADDVTNAGGDPAEPQSDVADDQTQAFVAPGFNGAVNPKPRYPLAARRRGQEGEVLLMVEVDTDGSVRTVAIKRSSGSSLLDRAAARAVRRWQFQPASLGAQRIVAQVDIPVLFRLSDVR